jgi:hypothetical protein
MANVKNKDWTSGDKCSCPGTKGVWLEHWRKRKGYPGQCKNTTCSKPATLGAHVININTATTHIVPLCEACNKLSDSFYVPDDTLVSATCN